MLSFAWLFVTPFTVACLTPLSTGFSRQEYWSGLPFPPSRDLLDSGIEPTSPASPALAGGFFATEPPGKPHNRPPAPHTEAYGSERLLSLLDDSLGWWSCATPACHLKTLVPSKSSLCQPLGQPVVCLVETEPPRRPPSPDSALSLQTPASRRIPGAAGLAQPGALGP